MTQEDWAKSMLGQVKYVIYDEASDSYLTNVEDMTWNDWWTSYEGDDCSGELFEYEGSFHSSAMFDSREDARNACLNLKLDFCEEDEEGEEERWFLIREITFGIQSCTLDMAATTPICRIRDMDSICFKEGYNGEERTQFQNEIVDILTTNFCLNYDLDEIAYKLEKELKDRGYKL